MIEMIGDLVAAITGYIKKGEFDKAGESLDNAYYQYLKEDASYFRNLEKEKLTEDLLSNHNYAHGHLEILSELFFAEAEFANAKKDLRSSLSYYKKSLILLDFVIKNSNTFSVEKSKKLELLKNKIKNYEE
jgi:hypothetical protein